VEYKEFTVDYFLRLDKLFLFIYCFFTIYSRYLKRVISKRDGCEYPSMVLWSLSNEILLPYSFESSPK
jgi:hypothetical protein